MPGQTGAVTAPPNGKPGRPSSLTPETSRRFTAALLQLHTLSDAAMLAGVDYSTVARWLQKGEKQRAGEYREFYEVVQKAKTQAKALLVKTVVEAARRDPALALKVLERRHPQEWMPQKKVEVEDKTPPHKGDVRNRVEGLLSQIAQRLASPAPTMAQAVAGDEDDDEED